MAEILWDDEVQPNSADIRWDDDVQPNSAEIEWDDGASTKVAPESTGSEYVEPTLYDKFSDAAAPVWDRTVEGIKRTPEAIQDFGAGIVAGVGDTVNFVGGVRDALDPKFYVDAYNNWDNKGIKSEDYKAKTESILGDAIKYYGETLADDKGSFPFFAGELASPVTVGNPIKTTGAIVKGAYNAASPALNAVNKVASPYTTKLMDGVTDAITRPSPTGSKMDWLKTQFVQDYKLSDEFVGMVDTQLRQGKIQNDRVMTLIDNVMGDTSQYNRDIIQYLVSKDRVAFPEAHRLYMTEPEKFEGISKKYRLYQKANVLKNQIWKNEDNLVDLEMIGSDNAVKRIQNRQNMNAFGSTEYQDAYVNRQYKNREALDADTMDPNLPRGRTIVDRRGMYDDEGKFIRSFNDKERTIMQPETNRVAEKSIAKQLDSVLQGRVMDRTNDMSDIVKTPDEMRQFVGKNPKSEDSGYTLLQGQEYGKLSGKYVQTQTANRIKSLVDDVNRDPSLWNAYRKYVGQWKAAVTIKNPKTHINNMLGNVGMMVTASDIPASEVSSIVKNGLEIHKAGPGSTVYDSALNAGLLERTKVQELAQMSGFDTASGQMNKQRLFKNDNAEKLLNNKFTQNAYMAEDSAIGKKVFGAYQKEDEVFKLGIFDHYLKQVMSAEDARAATEKIVFDYAKKLPKGVEMLRDTGFIPFVTWTYRSLPMFKELISKRPANFAATAGALALMNQDDDEITEPTVGDRKLNSKNWTPYMEYLNPQGFAKDQTLSGIPQQAAALAAGQNLEFGRMRTLDRKGMTPIDSLMGRAKAAYNLMPVPDVYNDIFDIGSDYYEGKRSIPDSAIHRLLMTNYPPKSSRNRKRSTRSNRKRDK